MALALRSALSAGSSVDCVAPLRDEQESLREEARGAREVLRSTGGAELFAPQEKSIEWMCWPFVAVGLASILDAPPKLGKTVFFLHGIHASRENRQFLNFPTRPMRVVYVEPKRFLESFIQKPFDSAWLFLGPSARRTSSGQGRETTNCE